MDMSITKVRDLEKRWGELELKRKSLISRCEEYARWTLPYIMPRENSDNIEMQNGKDSIGARGVNHLANRVVMTLYPAQTVFFRLQIDTETKQMIRNIMLQGNPANKDAVEQEIQKRLAEVETELAQIEKQANEELDLVQYRPTAVMAAKHLIITGNTLLFHPGKNKPVQQYSLRNYAIVRDISGNVIEGMTREKKAFETFRPEVQELLKNSPASHNKAKGYQHDSDVTIYTQFKLENDGRYHVYQCADWVALDTDGIIYTKEDLPWIPLVWNLVHGEDYGRGLVEEYAGTFHALEVLNTSLLNLAAIMSDIKWLVKPSSMVDVPEMNAAPSGSYHSGNEGDVTAIQLNKLNDAQFIASMIERYEKQLNDAFLLSSTRQAERVTAEEIRHDAQELEISNGGIYSRLAATWQAPTSVIILKQIGFEGLIDGIYPKVVTGMDSLSRQAELDNYRMFLLDLMALNNIPEDVRARLKLSDYMSLIGQARQIEYQRIIISEAEYQQMVQEAQEQERQRAEAEANAKAMAGVAQGLAKE